MSFLRRTLRGAALVLAIALATTLQLASWGCGSATVAPAPTPTHEPAPTTTTTWAEARGRTREQLDALVGKGVGEVEASLGPAFEAYVEVDPTHAEIRSYRVLVEGVGRRFVHVRLEEGKVVGPVDPR